MVRYARQIVMVVAARRYYENMTSSTRRKPAATSASAPTVSEPTSAVVVCLRPAQAAGSSSQPVTSSPSPKPDRVRIRGVELLRVGKWEAGTGPFDCTPEVIRSAAAAAAAGLLRAPVIRLGHDDPRFDAEPGVGWLENIRAVDGDTVLVADMAGVPRWLADAIPTAYPSRSIEGRLDWTDPDGRTWPFVLDGVALLGATPPAVESLADLRDFITAARPQPRTQPAARTRAARRRRLATYR